MFTTIASIVRNLIKAANNIRVIHHMNMEQLAEANAIKQRIANAALLPARIVVNFVDVNTNEYIIKLSDGTTLTTCSTFKDAELVRDQLNSVIK